MYFTDIRLQNYRSYDEASFDLGPGVNIVVGPNAAGKTNLLEALMVVATGKSFRGKDINLIKHTQNWLRLDVHTSENQTRVIKIKLSDESKTQKTLSIDDKEYKRLSALCIQPVVLFQPDDLRVVHDEPQKRRDYFDQVIEKYTPEYSKLTSDLRRVISQRNSLLKQQSFSRSQMFAWNIRLCELGSAVVTKRLDLVDQINKSINQTYKDISGVSKDLNIRYVSKTDTDNYSTSLMKQLEQNQELDRQRGFTSRGPHRDDFVAFFGETELSKTASRGENRTLILALKIFELKFLEEKTNKRPLLLLDDVFSELDGSRRKALTSFLSNYQTIITTTDADVVLKNFSKKSNVILI